MAGTLAGKVALVTGGARGIGKAICERLAAEGASLAIVDIMLDVAQATADEFTAKGINAKAYAANVAKFEDAESTIAKVVEDFGRLDILVNNANVFLVCAYNRLLNWVIQEPVFYCCCAYISEFI